MKVSSTATESSANAGRWCWIGTRTDSDCRDTENTGTRNRPPRNTARDQGLVGQVRRGEPDRRLDDDRRRDRAAQPEPVDQPARHGAPSAMPIGRGADDDARLRVAPPEARDDVQRQDDPDHRGRDPGDEGHDEEPRDAGQAQHSSVGRGGHVHDCAGAREPLPHRFRYDPDIRPARCGEDHTARASYPGPMAPETPSEAACRRSHPSRVARSPPGTARPAAARRSSSCARGPLVARARRRSWSRRLGLLLADDRDDARLAGLERRLATARAAERRPTWPPRRATSRRPSRSSTRRPRSSPRRRRGSPTWPTRRRSWATRTRRSRSSPTTSPGSRRRPARWRPRWPRASPASSSSSATSRSREKYDAAQLDAVRAGRHRRVCSRPPPRTTALQDELKR